MTITDQIFDWLDIQPGSMPKYRIIAWVRSQDRGLSLTDSKRVVDTALASLMRDGFVEQIKDEPPNATTYTTTG